MTTTEQDLIKETLSVCADVSAHEVVQLILMRQTELEQEPEYEYEQRTGSWYV